MKKIILTGLVVIASLVSFVVFPTPVHAIDISATVCTQATRAADCGVPADQVTCQIFGAARGGLNGQATCGYLNNPAGLPRSAAENYIKGTSGGATAESNDQKGLTPIIVESFGNMAVSGKGSIASVGTIMAAMYLNQPASLNTYVADLKENIGVPGTKNAYAQGAGFVSIQPVLGLWKMVRNVALGGFVIVFTVIGIMIMLRSKIDPRTVITIQQAIPRTVVALLLVIFSYAIIGLMIDLTSVITRLGATMLQAAGYIASDGEGSPLDPTKLDQLLSANIFENIWPMYNMEAVVQGIGNLPSKAFDPIQFILKAMQFTGTDVVGGLTGAVLAIALFIAIIRTFFMLLEAYLKVTLAIILSPLQFLAYAIPGQGKGFGDWARGILANLLIFPATFFMLAFAAIFYADGQGNGTWFTNGNPLTGVTNNWSVAVQTFGPGTTYWAPPGLGDWGAVVGPLLALSILLTIPKLGATVREVVNPAAKPGAAEGEAAKGVQAAAARIPVLGSFTKM